MTPLALRPNEQEVLYEALRRYEESEVRNGDLDKARIASHLLDHLRKGGAIEGIAEVPR